MSDPEPDPKSKEWKRSNFVAAPHFYNLNQACLMVTKAFDTCPYLVGSAMKTKDYRDVDVRLILPDEEYDRLFHDAQSGYLNAFWSLLCTSISMYLSKASDLPIDFQIQRRTQANEQHSGPRHPIGIFLDYPEKSPSEIVTPTASEEAQHTPPPL
jgi:hypothetical protein